MSAYNWINFKYSCPSCKQLSQLNAQTHVASDFGGTDERFCMKEYQLGDKMKWWTIQHVDYQDWKLGNLIEQKEISENKTEECCYTKCRNCESELYTIIEFKDISPKRIVEVGFLEHYPKEYYK